MSYIYYNPNPLHNFTGDCVVRAITKLLDSDWDTVYFDLSAQGFIHKAILTDDNIWGNYLAMKGYEMYSLPNTCPRCYSVYQFAEDHPYGKYLVKTPGHVIAVVDGDYYDSGDSGGEVPIYYWKEHHNDGY